MEIPQVVSLWGISFLIETLLRCNKLMLNMDHFTMQKQGLLENLGYVFT
jgi:hypothetical protein